MLLAAAAIAVGWTTGSAPHAATSAAARPLAVVRLAADSLLARARPMPDGGIAWRSAIQAPHYQTDRDVGAAGIGSGLLAAFAATHDARYLRGAVGAGDFLLGVAERADGGLRWPDWADPDGARSETHYTSFDDGAAGISDYLWKLYAATHYERFRAGALAGMRWLIAQASGASCPATACAWSWTDDPSSVAYDGLGMGQAGIVLTLDAFAARTGDPIYRAYARAGAAWLRARVAGGARPLPLGTPGETTFQTGYLAGSAGAALVFLERFARDHDPADLAAARGLLRWANGQASREDTAGFELGAAGIAWADLYASRVLHDRQYRDAARQAGAWLREVELADGAWTEEPGDPSSPVHIGLDSGAAGIGWVLADLARAGIDPSRNEAAAREALDGITAAAHRDSLGAFWYENRTGGTNELRAEPSWHWGAAGIAAFAAHLGGWHGCNPGGQPLLCGP